MTQVTVFTRAFTVTIIAAMTGSYLACTDQEKMPRI